MLYVSEPGELHSMSAMLQFLVVSSPPSSWAARAVLPTRPILGRKTGARTLHRFHLPPSPDLECRDAQPFARPPPRSKGPRKTDRSAPTSPYLRNPARDGRVRRHSGCVFRLANLRLRWYCAVLSLVSRAISPPLSCAQRISWTDCFHAHGTQLNTYCFHLGDNLLGTGFS